MVGAARENTRARRPWHRLTCVCGHVTAQLERGKRCGGRPIIRFRRNRGVEGNPVEIGEKKEALEPADLRNDSWPLRDPRSSKQRSGKSVHIARLGNLSWNPRLLPNQAQDVERAVIRFRAENCG